MFYKRIFIGITEMLYFVSCSFETRTNCYSPIHRLPLLVFTRYSTACDTYLQPKHQTAQTKCTSHCRRKRITWCRWNCSVAVIGQYCTQSAHWKLDYNVSGLNKNYIYTLLCVPMVCCSDQWSTAKWEVNMLHIHINFLEDRPNPK